jgi:hypothetical protein
MTLDELTRKWSRRLEEWRALAVRVDGGGIAAEVVRDLSALAGDDVVTLSEAAAIGGYSVDHLQRLVKSGKLRQYGRRHAPRIRRVDVPIKSGRHLSASP